jgi:phosphopantothenoylcysteine decarboxylase/phosphopantothenate--cysteine ligase
MGIALANACARRGAEVTLVCGAVSVPVLNPFGAIHRIDALSAQAMYEACMDAWPQTDIAILCAAVADFAPVQTALEKIKKEAGQTTMTLQLNITPDIAKALGESKKAGQTLIGFALETEHEKENALHKMERKKMDAIILNSLRNKGAGFGTDTNIVTILQANGNTSELPLLSKSDVAEKILDTLII